jgi:hypothetical protein
MIPPESGGAGGESTPRTPDATVHLTLELTTDTVRVVNAPIAQLVRATDFNIKIWSAGAEMRRMTAAICWNTLRA